MEKILNRIFVIINNFILNKTLSYPQKVKERIAFFNVSLVYFIVTSLCFSFCVKTFMLLTLGTYIAAKLFVITTTCITFHIFRGYLTRDFLRNSFSWAETLSFLIFGLQLFALSVGNLLDINIFFTNYLHSLPCRFFGETLDSKVEAFFKFILKPPYDLIF